MQIKGGICTHCNRARDFHGRNFFLNKFPKPFENKTRNVELFTSLLIICLAYFPLFTRRDNVLKTHRKIPAPPVRCPVSLIYSNHFYMTSIWGVPTAFPGTGRTELHPRKPPCRNTDKEHLLSCFKQVFRHFNRLSPTFLVRRTFPPAQPVHRIPAGRTGARFGHIFPSPI